MSCKVCGRNEMAKSHILPRALMHDIRGDDTEMFAADKNRQQWRHYQSGPWDRTILCQACEDSLKDCDDYAIRWMRRFAQVAVPCFDDKAFEVPNHKPALLVKFIASTVWKAGVSKHMAHQGLSLGPWEARLRQYVFAGHDEPRAIVFRKYWTVEGNEVSALACPPYNAPAWGRWAFAFDLAGFQFGLRLDRRTNPLAPFHPLMLINGADPALVINAGGKEAVDDAQIMSIVAAADTGGKRP